MAKTKKTDVYQMVADRIMSELEKGIIPWHRPWIGCGSNCISYTTDRPYSPLNCWLLQEPGEYITCKQCNDLGGTVKKGAKSKMVVFSKKNTWTETVKNEDGEDEERIHEYFTLKYYHVFNIKDCEGIKSKWNYEDNKSDLTPVEEAEKIVADYKAKQPTLTIQTEERSGEAYFSPSRDLIVVPTIGQYKDVAEYYSTLYHEMVHSTGVAGRCDRGLNSLAAHGKKEYSTEELVAETGSAMLVNIAGLDADKAFKNSVAYIQSWLKALKNDKKMIIIAAARAEKAVKYILNEQ